MIMIVVIIVTLVIVIIVLVVIIGLAVPAEGPQESGQAARGPEHLHGFIFRRGFFPKMLESIGQKMEIRRKSRKIDHIEENPGDK